MSREWKKIARFFRWEKMDLRTMMDGYVIMLKSQKEKNKSLTTALTASRKVGRELAEAGEKMAKIIHAMRYATVSSNMGREDAKKMRVLFGDLAKLKDVEWPTALAHFNEGAKG